MTSVRVAVAALLLPLAVAGCSLASGAGGDAAGADGSGGVASGGVASLPPVPGRPSASGELPVSGEPSASAAPTGATAPEVAAQDAPTTAPTESAVGKPAPASVSIPAIGVRELRVVPYRGSPDDGPGTEIQNGGVAASPHGPRGGVGPGGIGNYIVTAHRTSSTRAFEQLPGLRIGQRVHVVAHGTRYTYRVTATRWTSFRSRASLARQSAAVPGRPGRTPTRAMITLSTCATPEDHARGNYWADEYGNPEHRIDKIGVLVSSDPA